MRLPTAAVTAGVLLLAGIMAADLLPWIRSGGLHIALEGSHVEVWYLGRMLTELRAEPRGKLTCFNACAAVYESSSAKAVVEASGSLLKVVVSSGAGWAGVSCRVSGGLLWAPCGLPPSRELRWPLRYRLELYIPLVVYYWPSRDVGFTLCCPPWSRLPSLSFRLSEGVLEARVENLARGRQVEFWLIPHRGGPMSGLLLYLAEAGMEPSLRGELAGAWWCTDPYNITVENLELARRLGVKVIELHQYFPYYGLYAPQAESWLDEYDRPESWSLLREKVRLAKRYGMTVLVYIDLAECQHHVALRNFASSLCLSRDGKPVRGIWRRDWRRQTYLVNCDPSLEFGAYLLEQARALLERIPEADGLFADRADYSIVDYAHSDGVTEVEGMPCYTYSFAVERLLLELRRQLKGKLLVVNLPVTVEAVLLADAVSRDYTESLEPYKTVYQSMLKPCYLLYVGEDFQMRQLENLKLYTRLGALPGLDNRYLPCKLHVDGWRRAARSSLSEIMWRVEVIPALEALRLPWRCRPGFSASS